MCFKGSETRIEIMNKSDLKKSKPEYVIGITHLALEVKDRETVDEMTTLFKRDGYVIYGKPRLTGDGFYESVILDPDGNHIELMAH